MAELLTAVEGALEFGLIVDTETTGLSPERDRIIEIGILEFAVDGETPPVATRSYGALQDPGEVVVSPEIERLTGLSAGVLKGQAIDWGLVREFFERASLVVAHNVDFDRRFLEASGALTGLAPHWACSMRHIDWRKRHFQSLSLNYLAADHGFVNPFAHRALFDCATTFRLVAPHLRELIQRSWEREYMLRAIGSPFESREVLKARGYRWDAAERVWQKAVAESELLDERTFLSEKVYAGTARHEEVPLG